MTGPPPPAVVNDSAQLYYICAARAERCHLDLRYPSPAEHCAHLRPSSWGGSAVILKL